MTKLSQYFFNLPKYFNFVLELKFQYKASQFLLIPSLKVLSQRMIFEIEDWILQNKQYRQGYDFIYFAFK